MAHLFVRFKISDYGTFKAGFDAGAEDHRIAAGSKGAQIFRDAQDPNTVSVLLKFDSLENAGKFVEFMQTPEMQKIMQDGAVAGPPEAVHVFGFAEETAA